jgi:hypothetical protein
LRLARASRNWFSVEKTSPYPAAIAEEINRFEHYLKQVCGLRLATCTVRLQRVRAFLVDQFAEAGIRVSTVKPADVISFMRKYTEGWTAPSKRAAGDSLRSYFRFSTIRTESAALRRFASLFRYLGKSVKSLSTLCSTHILTIFSISTEAVKFRIYSLTRRSSSE